ncbi:MAG: hypothetical protein FJ304_16750 [Planctomycetes bacterium]|nr:hypothetical protein [Planctomycetota bacterium]
MISVRDKDIQPKYLLGILNSRLLRAFWIGHYYDRRRTFPKIKGTYLEELPVYFDTGVQDRLVSLVDRMLGLHTQLARAKTAQVRDTIQSHIDTTDGEIDRLVYDLYGLTADEIRIVEQSLAGTPTAPAKEED